MTNVGEQLARLRKERGLTHDELAKLAGTTGKYISNLEHGITPGINILAKLAVALDVPLEELYVKEEE